ncbi:transglutaminase-like domain-containing protein [Paenibacillus cymbidii]|uniref:transglutaminase-like domain-containing protein n=1 Tax=Paenibacillus cymbidii TaxID=1639034 RepID=UPI0010804F10|nr:transglutaminase-like domain-containing protein [Paenibacillus cymbidii]
MSSLYTPLDPTRDPAAEPTRDMSRADRLPADKPPLAAPLKDVRETREWSRRHDLFVTLLLLALLREWLEPIAFMSGLSSGWPFAVYVGFGLLADWMRLPALPGWVLKIAAGLATTGYIIDPPLVRDSSWWLSLGPTAAEDIASAVAGRPEAVSAESRVLLFLLGWALMAQIARSLLLYTRSGLWIVAATLGYVALLPLWSDVGTVAGVVRAAAVGLLLLAAMHLPHAARRGQLPQSTGRKQVLRSLVYAAFVPLLLFAAAYGAAGLQSRMPDAGAWPELYRLWDRWNGQPGGGAIAASAAAAPGRSAAVSGYGSDDSALGGPLQSDEQIAFVAHTEKLAYWRGEAKSFYDGRGWTQPAGSQVDIVWDESAAARTLADTMVQEVAFPTTSVAGRQLFAGGAIVRVYELRDGSWREAAPDSVRRDSASGKYTTVGVPSLSYYKLAVALPVRDSAALPEAEAAANLQLPAALPQRVAGLARSIVGQAGAADARAQAEALAAYLQRHYRYSLQDARVPEQGADFVDSFLFGGGSGYCDYFSTAMAVMLRTLGIPARWVKGFTPGEAQPRETAAEGFDVTVRNADAHSWVEAYLPGEGWQTFDPTPGFAGHADNATTDSPLPGDAAAFAAATAAAADGSTPSRLLPQLQAAAAEWLDAARRSAWAALQAAAHGARTAHGWLAKAQAAVASPAGRAASLAALVAAAALLFAPYAAGVPLLQARLRQLQAALREPAPPHPGPPPDGAAALDKLWRRVYRRFGSRAPNHTVREYIASLRGINAAQRDLLLELAALDESARYTPLHLRRISRKRLAALWEQLREHR